MNEERLPSQAGSRGISCLLDFLLKGDDSVQRAVTPVTVNVQKLLLIVNHCHCQQSTECLWLYEEFQDVITLRMLESKSEIDRPS